MGSEPQREISDEFLRSFAEAAGAASVKESALSGLHLIQYVYDYEHITTALCPQHRSELRTFLREIGVGCVATTAPSLSRCDACETNTLQP